MRCHGQKTITRNYLLAKYPFDMLVIFEAIMIALIFTIVVVCDQSLKTGFPRRYHEKLNSFHGCIRITRFNSHNNLRNKVFSERRLSDGRLR